MPKKNDYWNQDQELAVINYNKTDCRIEKQKIFKKYLETPLQIMTQSIIRRYPTHLGNYTMEEVEKAAISHLMTCIHGFNENYIGTNGYKAKSYSYCQTIIRNFYINHSKVTYFNKKTHPSYEENTNEYNNNPNLSYELDDSLESTMNQLLEHVCKNIEKMLNQKHLTEEEKIVGRALIDVFKNWNFLFMEETPDGKFKKSISDKFKKSKIVLYIHEITNLPTKTISQSLKPFRDMYFLKKDDFFNND